ncbi:MAG: hypothetical protein HC811_04825 [Flammeovirgaceae bacterium]|nr:hypothetical protein [Flammeovirgaceae bacterium]
MRKAYYLTFTFALFTVLLVAQERTGDKTEPIAAVASDDGKKVEPLWVINVENRKIESPDSQNVRDTLLIGQIKPDWIQSVNVLKGNQATDAYGERAAHGAVVVNLKNGTLAKMPAELRSKFKN